jgi:hypothetical protein
MVSPRGTDMKTLVLAFVGLMVTVPAQAEELSPWFGGENTAPFQVAVDTTQAVATAETPLAVVPEPCTQPDCPLTPNLAIGSIRAVAP